MLSDGEKVAVVAGCHTTERHKRQHSQDCATARIGFTNCACGKRSASSCWGRETRLERGKYQINGPIQLRQAAARIEVEGRRACERARDEQACERARERETERETERESLLPSLPLFHTKTHTHSSQSHTTNTHLHSYRTGAFGLRRRRSDHGGPIPGPGSFGGIGASSCREPDSGRHGNGRGEFAGT